jgi:hypothetical protein
MQRNPITTSPRSFAEFNALLESYRRVKNSQEFYETGRPEGTFVLPNNKDSLKYKDLLYIIKKILSFFFFLAVLGFEHRVSHFLGLIGRHFIT